MYYVLVIIMLQILFHIRKIFNKSIVNKIFVHEKAHQKRHFDVRQAF